MTDTPRSWELASWVQGTKGGFEGMHPVASVNTQVISLGEKWGYRSIGICGVLGGIPVLSFSPSASVIIMLKKAATLPSWSSFFLCHPPSVPVYPLLKLLSERLPGLIQLNADPSSS